MSTGTRGKAIDFWAEKAGILGGLMRGFMSIAFSLFFFSSFGFDFPCAEGLAGGAGGTEAGAEWRQWDPLEVEIYRGPCAPSAFHFSPME